MQERIKICFFEINSQQNFQKMKSKFFHIGFWFAVLVSVNSCKEIGPNIVLRPSGNSVGDTTYVESPVATPETKNVYIEDFTGAHCINCPDGHLKIENLKTANPGRVVSISLHPYNSLANPYPGEPDFRTNDAQELYTYFNVLYLPQGTVDRKLFSGETSVALDRTKWTAKTNTQLSETTPVNMQLNETYDSVTRELLLTVELHYTQTVYEKNNLTVFLTESNITAMQANGSSVDSFYIHDNVFRKSVTNTKGDLLTDSLEAGRVIRKIYKVTLNNTWVWRNVKAIAVVHESVNAKVAYQVKEIAVQ